MFTRRYDCVCRALLILMFATGGVYLSQQPCAETQLMSTAQMRAYVGSDCCKRWAAGEDCQKCLPIREGDENRTKRFNAGGVAPGCVDGPPDGCEPGGTFECGVPDDPRYFWKYYLSSNNCTGTEHEGSQANRSLTSAIGALCAEM
jgi:hypothetical protein